MDPEEQVDTVDSESLFEVVDELATSVEELQNELSDLTDKIDAIPTEPQIIEKTTVIKGEPGKSIKGDPGKAGKMPTQAELIALIKPLIPPPVKGDPGKDGETRVLHDYGGGNANRQIAVNGTPIQTYTDVNLVGSITQAQNNTTKQTDITITGGGTPAAPDTSVQFNDGGNFGGDSELLWDKVLKQLKIGKIFFADHRLGTVSPDNFTVTTTSIDSTDDTQEISTGAVTHDSGRIFLLDGSVGGDSFIDINGVEWDGAEWSGDDLLIKGGSFKDGSNTPVATGISVILHPGQGATNGVVAMKDAATNNRADFDTSALTDNRKITLADADMNFNTAASGSFTSADLKTVTVVNGIITSIV